MSHTKSKRRHFQCCTKIYKKFWKIQKMTFSPLWLIYSKRKHLHADTSFIQLKTHFFVWSCMFFYLCIGVRHIIVVLYYMYKRPSYRLVSLSANCFDNKICLNQICDIGWVPNANHIPVYQSINRMFSKCQLVALMQ